MILKEELLQNYNLSEEDFEDADISWEDLQYIYNDFSGKRDHYKEILANFEKDYLENIDTAGIHSYRTRVKDAEHLVVKIIRKRVENYQKYRYLTKDNYERFLTDLIGIRCFILFKERWEEFHRYIVNRIDNDPKNYIEDFIKDFDENEKHIYMAEKPKVHIRNGDNRKIYEHILAPDCITSNRIYRSVHYIVKYQGVYLEIQVRTLFEEGWGEIDHDIVYPYYEDNSDFQQYTQLLNRLSGLADEMGSFFNRLKMLELEYLKNKGYQEAEREESALPDDGRDQTKVSESISDIDSVQGCLMEIMAE